MYEIVEMKLESEKRKFVLETMTQLKHRQLSVSELREIYLDLLKMINIATYNSELFNDLAKVIFIINHYCEMENNTQILLEGLHLCKLKNLHDEYIKHKLNACIQAVGNFNTTSNLVQIVTNILLMSNRYLSLMNNNFNEKIFWGFVHSSINSDKFHQTGYYLSFSAYFDENGENADQYLVDLFENLKILMSDKYEYWNYLEFMNWYLPSH